jgi:peptidyl-prolyl cis-trans isomerase C
MSRKSKLLVALLTILIAMFVSYKTLISSEQVVAKVNGQPIHLSEILKEYYTMVDPESRPDASFEKLDDKMKYNIVKSIILGDLLDKKAIEAKVEEGSLYKKYVANAMKEIRQKVFLDELIEQKITSEAINSEYNKISSTMQNAEELKVEQLLFANEADALVAYTQAEKGDALSKIQADFESKKTQVKFEVLDYFGTGDMLKEFETVSFGLKIGQIAKPFKTDFGWHLIKLIDKRKKTVPSLSEMQDSIKNSLTEAFVSQYINDLISQNAVEILIDKNETEQK